MNAPHALHPTDQTLSSYGLGKLDDASAESVDQHLESCPECRRRVADLSPDSFLGRLREAKPQPDSPSPVVSATDGLSKLDAGSGSPAPPPASTLPPGLADHPDYEIIRELGRGGMGVVYLAQNTLMGRPEVLKVVGSHLISRPGVLDRFLREIRSAAKLHHHNIVAAYSALRFGESLVLSMEYVEGDDLARMVKAKGPLPVVNACYYIHQAALGLQHAHEHGMVHRDIKPANLILARVGKKQIVKVLDFGLAKVTSEGQDDRGLTREGQMLGTPEYIAPEQIRNAQSADIRADIYSLGCTFYCLLTGGPPFGGDNLWDLYQAHFSMDATPLNMTRPEVPVEVAALVAKMMAKEPKKRFQTPGEVAQALVPFFKPGTVASVGSKPEISQMTQLEVRPHKTGVAASPTQPATEMPPAPAPSPRKAVEPTQPGSILEGLIDLRETESLFDTMLDRTPPPAVPKLGQQVHRAWSKAVERLGGFGPRGLWVAAGVLLLGLIVAWTVIVRVKTADGVIVLENLPEDAEVFLFNGKDLSGWVVDSGYKSFWRIENGELVVTGPGDYRKTGWLLTDRDYSEFLLKFDFQPSPGANSGVAFWARPGVLFEGIPHHPQIELFDADQGGIKNGSFVWKTSLSSLDILSPDRSVDLKPADQWNTMEVEVRGGMLRVEINSREVFRSDLAKLAEYPGAHPGLRRQSGRIGLLSHTGVMRFRNIKIKELSRSADGPESSSAASPSASIDLLRRIDLRRDAKRGRWQRQKTSLISVPGQHEDVIEIPYRPPAEYRLEITAERIGGLNDLQIGVVCGQTRCVIVLDGWSGQASGISWVDGRFANANENTYRGRVFADTGPTHLVVTVRKGQIHVTANGRSIINWQGSEDRLSLRSNLGTDPGTLFLAVQYGGSYRIDEARLTPLAEWAERR